MKEFIQDNGLENIVHDLLPKMADVGVIEYNHRSEAVRPRRTVEILEPVLDACEEVEEAVG